MPLNALYSQLRQLQGRCFALSATDPRRLVVLDEIRSLTHTIFLAEREVRGLRLGAGQLGL
jgi:hypothetical protein